MDATTPITSKTTTISERYWVPSGASVKNPEWTPELVQEAKRLKFVEKLSAGAIAKRLGFTTRNAVIGKFNRLGITEGRAVRARGTELSEYAKQKRIEKRIATRHRIRVKLIEEQPAVPIPLSDAEIPDRQRCALLDLTNSTCRWPVGEPNQPGFFFCGTLDADMSANRPYCKRHAAVACRKY
jgi:GcrA cell cycle regulator